MGKNNRFGKAAILTEMDMAKLRKVIDNPTHRLFIEIAWWTGERFGAIRQLQVSDCYQDPVRAIPRDEITFRAYTRKSTGWGQRMTRQVDAHPTLQAILRSYEPSGSVFLFPSPATLNKPMGFSTCDKFLRAALVKCGLDTKGISTHSFRRSFITRLSEQGCDPRVIMAITGHADPKSLAGYVEVSRTRIKNAIASL